MRFGKLTTHLLQSSKCSVDQIDHLADRLYPLWSNDEGIRARTWLVESGFIHADLHEFFMVVLNQEGMTMHS